MEEIKSQLGDRMPVAMAIGAKSMGLSVDKFIKKVSDGQVKSKDFIRGFATELRKSVRGTGALLASLDSVRTARANLVTTWSIGVFEGFIQASEGMKAFFSSISKMIIENVGGFRVIGEIVGLFFKVLATGLDLVSPLLFLFTRSLEHVRSMFDDAFNVDIATDKLSILEKVIRGIGIAGLGALWLIQKASEELTAAVENLTGEKSGGGFSFLKDLFSLWVAGSILVWLGKLIARFSGLKFIFEQIKKLAKGDIGKELTGTDKTKPKSKMGKVGRMIKGAGVIGILAGATYELNEAITAGASKEYSNMFMGMKPEHEASVTGVLWDKMMSNIGLGSNPMGGIITNTTNMTVTIPTQASAGDVKDRLEEIGLE